jgi:hypothetical protein
VWTEAVAHYLIKTVVLMEAPLHGLQRCFWFVPGQTLASIDAPSPVVSASMYLALKLGASTFAEAVAGLALKVLVLCLLRMASMPAKMVV